MILVIIVALGLVTGSFIGAFSYRYPEGISIAKGRSSCPDCKKIISARDNIPVISYLFLGGKCRNCQKPISLRYPLIETSIAVLFVLAYRSLTQGSPLSFWAGGFLGYVFVATILLLMTTIFVIDLEHMIIPDELNFFGFFFVVLFLLFYYQQFFVNIFAGLVSSLFLLLLHLATKGKGMGLGDVKFAVLAGSILGIDLIFQWQMLAFVIGGIVSVILLLTKKASFGKQIAFGPFLVVSFLITFMLGSILPF